VTPHVITRRTAADAETFKALARVIRELRAARDLTQEQVALAGGVYRTHCFDVESAKRDSRFLKLRALLIGLGNVEWPEFGRALQAIDPLQSRGSPKRLRDIPRPSRPTFARAGLEGLAIVLRSFREGLGVSQETFAYQNGFDGPVIGYVERGRRNIGVIVMRRLVVALALTWVEFFDALDIVDRLAVARRQTRLARTVIS
jgi:transcriptional regulator with XRE-family HTH domain